MNMATPQNLARDGFLTITGLNEASDRGLSGPEYVRFLLEERKRELRTIELENERSPIMPQHYISCRRSLLQAIGQLEDLIAQMPRRMGTIDQTALQSDGRGIKRAPVR
jgi:hypothetical protein